jgi:hypothetical protein
MDGSVGTVVIDGSVEVAAGPQAVSTMAKANSRLKKIEYFISHSYSIFELSEAPLSTFNNGGRLNTRLIYTEPTINVLQPN